MDYIIYMDNLFLIIKYALFGGIATVINLALQFISFQVLQSNNAIYIAIFIGTLGGLIVKYTLDKQFIFKFTTKNRIEGSKNFLLYSFFGMFTTIIFWLTELLFDKLVLYSWSKYIGAVIGLSFGYTVKYFLDKKFVFGKALK